MILVREQPARILSTTDPTVVLARRQGSCGGRQLSGAKLNGNERDLTSQGLGITAVKSSLEEFQLPP